MLAPCAHVSGKYSRTNCPVCEGRGFYFDVRLDQAGSVLPIEGLNKTVQGLTHLLLSEENTFAAYGYPEYGSRALRFIGSKNLDENRLRFQVLRDIQYYVSLKERQNFEYNNITDNEVIRQIIGIETTSTADEQSVSVAALIGSDDRIQFFEVQQFSV